jgi:hypothetical protein
VAKPTPQATIAEAEEQTEAQVLEAEEISAAEAANAAAEVQRQLRAKQEKEEDERLERERLKVEMVRAKQAELLKEKAAKEMQEQLRLEQEAARLEQEQLAKIAEIERQIAVKEQERLMKLKLESGADSANVTVNTTADTDSNPSTSISSTTISRLPPVPEETKTIWYEYEDKASGKKYYYDPISKKTSWTVPANAMVEDAQVLQKPRKTASFLALKPAPEVSKRMSVIDATMTSSESTERPGWICIKIQNSWKSNGSDKQLDTCGGCYPNFPSWRRNTQFFISPSDPKQDVKVFVQLLAAPLPDQESSSFNALVDADRKKKARVYGFYVFKHSGPFYHKVAVAKDEMIVRSTFVVNGVTTAEFTLPATFHGSHNANESDPQQRFRYCIIPSTLEPDFPMQFDLNVHCEKPCSVSQLTPSMRVQECCISGEWIVDENAGGCRNHISWINNPQYLVNLSKSVISSIQEEGDESKGEESKSNSNGHANGQSKLTIMVLQPGDAASMKAIGLYVATHQGLIIAKSTFIVSTEVSCVVDFDPAQAPYVVVPCTFAPNCAGKFTVSVFSNDPSAGMQISVCSDDTGTSEQREENKARKRTMTLGSTNSKDEIK